MTELLNLFDEYIVAEEQAYEPHQWGARILNHKGGHNPENADVILVGCTVHTDNPDGNGSVDAVRRQFYNLYCWHDAISVYDAGNVKQGATASDTVAAILMALEDIDQAGKIAIVIAPEHELTLLQYEVFRKKQQLAKCIVADMLIDLDEAALTPSKGFLMEMLTGTPNFIEHYSHIAFQSYYVQPRMLEALDKLRFDFYRLGIVKEDIEQMEPVLRSADFFSFDLSAIRYPDAICNFDGSPNGLTGEEACTLTRYAGMAEKLSSFGVYGYHPAKDQHEMSARLVAQMIWYFIDGLFVRWQEASKEHNDEFLTFNVVFTDHEIPFLKSKRTNRWWMQMPDGKTIPCSHKDYIQAGHNEIPERWLREHERLV